MLVRVAADARCDDQVDDGRLLLPVLLLVGSVLLVHGIDEVLYEGADLLFEELGELRDELHTVATSRLRVRLLQVVLDILSRLTFVLLQVLLRDGDVGKD